MNEYGIRNRGSAKGVDALDPLRVRAFPIRAAIGLRRACQQPGLIKDLASKLINRKIIDTKHQSKLKLYDLYKMGLVQGIEKITKENPVNIKNTLEEDEFTNLLREVRQMSENLNIPYLAGSGFLEICYSLIRLMKPIVVLETGVAHGWTSASILAALEKNTKGHLYSVDLPAFVPGSIKWSGGIVPERLKSRWTLSLGSQAKLLPGILSTISRIDFFHYDSDKTYQGMISTFRMIWPKLSSKGLLVSDDLDNDAFFDFAESVYLDPVILIKPIDGKRVGILRHP